MKNDAEKIAALGKLRDDLTEQVADLQAALNDANKTIVALRPRMAASKQQVNDLTAALTACKADLATVTGERDDLKAQVAQLTKELEDAKAKIDRLAAERSVFFAKLKAALDDKYGVKIVGDRFVFPSAVLFDVGSAEVRPEGVATIQMVANVVKELAGDETLKSLHSILQVNGHTDKQKIIRNGKFADNWELSTERALSVVRLLIGDGVEPVHLAAAGFGEFQPMAEGNNEDAYMQNRRIEFKLTDDGPLLKGL